MAVTFPRSGLLALAQLSTDSSPFRLQRRQEMSRTASGQTLAKDLGPALWTFDLVTVPIRKPAAFKLLAFLESLDGFLGSVMLHDATRERPASDPTGAANLVGVSVGAATGQTLRLDDLPAGFVLTPGDLIGIAVPSGAQLYEISEAATANGLGTATVDVSPELRPGVLAGQAITMVRPEIEFQVTNWNANPSQGLFLSFTIQGLEL